VLGPKPKHQPQKEKESLASSMIAGAVGVKRKFQDLVGYGSASGSAPNSPKKRKTSAYANAAAIKQQNALAEKAAAREKAEQTKAEAAAQAASRKNRALHRSTSMILSSSRRTKVTGRRTRHSLPITKTKTSRHTTIDYKRRTPKSVLAKPGSLKAIRKTVRRTPIALSKSRVSLSKTPKTQVRDSTPESESESEESPNITPASLRSANKKQLKQTQLNFKPLNFGGASSDSSDSLKYPDSDSDFEVGSRVKRPKKGPAASTSVRGSVKKTLSRSIKGTKRTFKGMSGRATSGMDD
jgi:palmitoyltransferase ZDHHC9/14/18